MSLSLITYPNNTHVNLETGDVHLDGALYNNAGVIVNTVNVAVASVSGSPNIVVVLPNADVFTPIPSTAIGSAYNYKVPPVGNSGFTAFTTTTPNQLFVIKTAGIYQITYTILAAFSLAGTVVTSCIACTEGFITQSECEVEIITTGFTYNFVGTALQTFNAGDVVNAITLGSGNGPNNATIQSINVICQLVG